MAKESGFDKDITDKEQITASMQHSPNTETEKTPEKFGNFQDSDRSKKKKEVVNILPYYKLFSFSDSTDYVLMIVGTLTAIGNGSVCPLRAVLLGEVIDSFGEIVNTRQVVHQVSKVALKYVYLAVGSGVAAFFQVVCWVVTGERQAARIRSLYLRTILRQEIGFFDKEINTGETIGRMSGDTFLIGDAMGEKVGKFIQLVATFLGGFVIALIKGWLLTLVLLLSVPALVISGGIMSILMAKLTSRGQSAYTQAGTVVEQTIGSIRTIWSAIGLGGLGSGVFMFFIFCTYSMAVWYGAKMIIHKDYSGGKVMNVIAAVLTASFSLGQASPCLSAFTSRQVAAFKMFETFSSKPEIDPYDTNGRKLDDIHGDIGYLLQLSSKSR
ncbi:ABC transporter B family member 11 like [Actinidia chinensis var. chinensis]|uniref:ABC transporter B family member 11 like n=1 Tax=Actinidia chinensis var. chinensis TaxID=1590841 RepID=A0A2R6PVS0_ACTCC|nr:ABC transporter B family member 11 like [Actinidia chinensis var. chinensis]